MENWHHEPCGIQKVIQKSKTMPVPTINITTLRGHTGAVNHAIFSADGQYCLTASSDRSIKLWNPHKQALITTYTGHGKEVLGLALAKGDNSQFVSCSGDRNIFVWDVPTGKQINRFSSHLQRVNSVSCNAEGSVICSGSYDATVRLWDTRQIQHKTIQILKHAKDSVESVKIDGYEIVTGCVDGFVRIYDIRTRDCVQDYVGESITSVQLTNDKQCILISSLDSTIRLLDKDNGELLQEYKGHENKTFKSTAAVKPDDSKVIAGGEDGKIFVWDLVDGVVEEQLSGHTDAVTCINYHPARDMMLSTSLDCTCKLWTA